MIMKKALIVTIALLVVTFCYACEDGTGGCGTTSNVCTEDGSTVDGARESKLYYPCDISEPVGATTVTGGFVEKLQDFNWLSTSIAEEGYVALAFTVNDNTGMVDGWVTSHLGAIKRLKEINREHKKLKGLIDLNKLQTCGHSKGGGSSLWAASILGDDLRTAVGMAPWQEYGFRYDPDLNKITTYDYKLEKITAATLIQGGSTDTLAVPDMTRQEYRGLGNISKAYFEFTDIGHIAWYHAEVTPKISKKLSGNIIAWMKYYLDGDTSVASKLADDSECTLHEWVK